MRLNTKHTFAALLFSSVIAAQITPVSGHAQATSKSNETANPELRVAQQAISRASFLIGEWEGDGWIQMGPGARTTFRQTENITSAANRTAIVIRGEGSARDSASGQWQVVFQAAALLTYDAATTRYSMLSAGGSGRALTTEPEIRDNGLTWGFETPGARIRYVINITQDGRFVETGEMSPDGGATWRQFFFMDLRKK